MLTRSEKLQYGRDGEDIFFTKMRYPWGPYPEWLVGVIRGTGFDDSYGIDGYAIVEFGKRRERGYIPIQVKVSRKLFDGFFRERPHLKGLVVEAVCDTRYEYEQICRNFYPYLRRIYRQNSARTFHAFVQDIVSKDPPPTMEKFIGDRNSDRGFPRAAGSILTEKSLVQPRRLSARHLNRLFDAADSVLLIPRRKRRSAA